MSLTNEIVSAWFDRLLVNRHGDMDSLHSDIKYEIARSDDQRTALLTEWHRRNGSLVHAAAG